MKIPIDRILLILVLIVLGWSTFFNVGEVKNPDPVTIVIPESSGTSGKVDLEQPVEKDTVYIKGDSYPLVVDSGYKALYEKALDSLEKKELYLQAVAIRTYKDTILDNEEIVITGEAETRGWLLNYKVDYNIKEKKFVYTPEVVTQLPKLTLGAGLELGIPTSTESNFALKGNISAMNKKGNEINISYDTNETVWLGYKLNFKIIK